MQLSKLIVLARSRLTCLPDRLDICVNRKRNFIVIIISTQNACSTFHCRNSQTFFALSASCMPKLAVEAFSPEITNTAHVNSQTNKNSPAHSARLMSSSENFSLLSLSLCEHFVQRSFIVDNRWGTRNADNERKIVFTSNFTRKLIGATKSL